MSYYKISLAKRNKMRANKKLSNKYLEKLIYELSYKEIDGWSQGYSPDSENKATTYYLSYKNRNVRISTHMKKEYNINENGFIINMRNVRKNDIIKDRDRILASLKYKVKSEE